MGGANALIPVIQELLRRDPKSTTVLATGEASTAFSAAGVEYIQVSAPEDFTQKTYQDFDKYLTQFTPDVMLLGTRWDPSLEKALLRTAQDRNIPSVSVLDMWINIRERFIDSVAGGLRPPTKVAVMDRFACDLAMEAGLTEETVVATGQPHLEAAAVGIQQTDLTAQSDSLRGAWLAGASREAEARIILFASEPLAREYGPGTPYYRGYTEADAIEGLVEAVEIVERLTQRELRVVLKLHPEETPQAYHYTPLKRLTGAVIATDLPAWPCVLAADVVVGMTSTLLLESAIAGRPTVSFQPGHEEKDGFIGTRMGLVRGVASTAELASLLTSLLHRNHESGGPGLPALGAEPEFMRAGAAIRVADLVLEVAASARSPFKADAH